MLNTTLAYSSDGLATGFLATLPADKGPGEDFVVPLKHERRVFLLSVRSASYPHIVEPIGLEQTIAILDEIYRANAAMMLLTDSGLLADDDDAGGDTDGDDDEMVEGTDPSNAIYIADMKIDANKKLATVLIVRGDPEITNPGYTNPVTKTVRVDKPKRGEAPGYSAHLLISYAPEHVSDFRGRAVLERMPTVSRSIVFAFLNRLLRKYAASHPGFEYDVKQKEKATKRKGKKEPKHKPYRPRLAVAGKKSSTLQEDIKKGYVSSVDLIDKQATFTGYDTENKVRELTRRLEFKLDPNLDEKGVVGFIKKLAKRGKTEKFDEVQVHIRGLAGDATASPRFKLDVAEAEDFLYIRNERISGFSKELAPIYSQVENEIAGKMGEMIVKKSLWSS